MVRKTQKKALLLLLTVLLTTLLSVVWDSSYAFAATTRPNEGAESAVSGGSSSGSTASVTSGDSWMDGVNTGGIYSDEDGKVHANEIGDGDINREPKTPEKLLMSLTNSVAGWLDGFFENLGVTIDNAVFGRVGGGGVTFNSGAKKYRVSLFTFELKKGNPYGIIATAAYSALRSIIYILIVCIVFARLCMAAFPGRSASAINTLKESVSSFAMAIALLALMPYLLDVILYVRDAILYAVGYQLSNAMGFDRAQLSFASIFQEMSEQSLMGSLMYLGSCLLSLWYALQYVGLALGYVMYFIAFPFVCVNLQYDRRALTNWCMEMLGYLAIPIADVTLLMIPLAIGKIGTAAAIQIFQLMVCSMLIPARAVLRGAMGLQRNTGMELAGVAAMMGAASLARGAVRTTAGIIGGTVQKTRSAIHDSQMANMYEQMAEGEKKTDQELEDMYGQQNGYGVYDVDGHVTVGEKEKDGIDSYITGAQELEKRQGLTPGTLYDGSVSDAVAWGQIDVPETKGASAPGGGSNIEPGSLSFGRPVSMAESLDVRNQQGILDSSVNVSNMDDPAFRNVSNERKAQLYRERARRTAFSAVGGAVGGTAGMLGGGALGLGASTFFSPAAKMQMTALGMEGGGAFGTMAGEGAGAATYGVGQAVGVARNVIAEDKIAQLAMSQPDVEASEPVHSVYESPEQKAALQQAVTEYAYAQTQANNLSNLEGAAALGVSVQDVYNPEHAEYLSTIYSDVMKDSSFENENARIQEFASRSSSALASGLESELYGFYGCSRGDNEAIDSLVDNTVHLRQRQYEIQAFSAENLKKHGFDFR